MSRAILQSCQSAEMGHGIAIALSYMVSEKIRDGKLVPILDGFTLPPQPVHLVYPQGRLIAPKIRAFVDFATPRLKAVLDQLAIAGRGHRKTEGSGHASEHEA